ncbi:glycosyltransferase [Bacteroidales bacterium OttesenSCG-928-M06]|nr:glycosyltransferase [Bacteroidales bacterium OttesenSCG-928-M06]
MEYLLSVIIPTRNRQKYAFNAVKKIIREFGDKIEVVIQDNSDNLELKQMLLDDNLSTEEIKYYHSYEDLSFVENFSRAIENSTGSYLCIIGDDDCVIPDILAVVRWARDNGIQAIKPCLTVSYVWPDSGFDKNEGSLSILPFSLKFKYVNPRNELKKLARNGFQDYLSYDIVKLYHGIVSRDKLNEIREKTGKYVGGLTPDIYMAVSLSLVIDKMLCLDYPLTLPGVCKASGSADSVTGKHKGDLSKAPHFKGHTEYEWAEEVPLFYSVETIWADSALAAIRDLDDNVMYASFCIEWLLAYCWLLHKDYADEIKRIIKKNKVSFIKVKYLSRKIQGKTILKKIKYKIKFKYRKVFTNVPTIADAVDIFKKNATKQSSFLNNILEKGKTNL